MLLSVIIVNFNTKNLLKNCLESIFRHTKRLDFEVIVVDNASTDGSDKYIKNEILKIKNTSKKLKNILNKKNLGFAKANNQGITMAAGKHILLLNSDTLLKNNAFLKMVKFMDEHREVSVLGPRLLNADGTKQASVGRFPTLPVVGTMLFREHFGGSRFVRWSPDQACEVDWVMGAALLARKEVFDTAGLLDEKIFMYMEEVEWCYRAKMAKKKIFYYPGAEIIHLWQGSSSTGRTGPILQIYRGLIYFYQKHRGLPALVVLRLLLKLKALAALLVGYLTFNRYLRQTYAQAFKIA